MEWNQGYIADIEYIHGFYAELAPEQLAMAALMRGNRAPALTEGFTYFEMGCGQGDSLNLLAAANPRAGFTAMILIPPTWPARRRWPVRQVWKT